MNPALRPLTIFGLAVALVAALALSWTGLARLHRNRLELQAARLGADAARAPLRGLVAPGNAYEDGARAIAAEALRLKLLEQAVDRRLLVERIEIEPVRADASAAIVARVAVSGPEAAVLQYAAAIERSRPLIRFTDWRLASAAANDGTIRLEGHATVLWVGP